MTRIWIFCPAAAWGLLFVLGCGGGATETTGGDTGGSENMDAGTIADTGSHGGGDHDDGGGDATGTDEGWTDAGGPDAGEDGGSTDAGNLQDGGRPDGGTDGAGRYGVYMSQFKSSPTNIAYLLDLGASWVGANSEMNGADVDMAAYLEAGIDLVIVFDNHDPNNADTTYGTLGDWPHAGFPYVKKGAYQQRIRDLVAPLLPYLDRGRHLWLQCEVEIGDASKNSDSVFWRGTTDEYVRQLDAFHEVARALDPRIKVLPSSLASPIIDDVTFDDAEHPLHHVVKDAVADLLARGKYDIVDLDIFGCAEDLPIKLDAIRALLPSGKKLAVLSTSGPDWFGCQTYKTKWTAPDDQYEQDQAKEVGTRLQACADSGGEVCAWFALHDVGSISGKTEDWDAHLGLIERGTNRQKPAYFAFKEFVAARR